jgi:alkane 1-monooxygenase
MSQQAIRTDFIAASPFWISLVYVPILAFAGWQGGAWLWLTPIYGWWATSLIDFVTGLRTDNPDTATPDET